jgi:hypothetical protein
MEQLGTHTHFCAGLAARKQKMPVSFLAVVYGVLVVQYHKEVRWHWHIGSVD